MNENRSVAEVEALQDLDIDKEVELISNPNLSKQFEALVLNAKARMHTVSLGYSNYFIVFKPMSRAYNRDEERLPGYHHRRGLNDTGKKIMALKPLQYVSSTEIMASKVHHNYIVKTCQNLVELLHEKIYKNKYKIYCQVAGDLDKVINYIYDEANIRVFKPNIDYNMKDFKKSPLYKGLLDLNSSTVAPPSSGNLVSTDVEGDEFVVCLS